MDNFSQLSGQGQSCWLDNLTHHMIASGELERRVREQGIRGVTSNPAIFHKALSSGHDYDARIDRHAAEGLASEKIYEQLVTGDVRDACDILRPVFDNSNGSDGFVSLEVSPHLAHDATASIAEARRLWAIVDRPNLMIKIPGTREGLDAIEELLSDGINVNITLLFSVQRYQEVAAAHMRALERRSEAGKSIDTVASVASFFLSRIDTLVDELLAHRIGSSRDRYPLEPERLSGMAAVASAKLAYERFLDNLRSDRWQALAQKGAHPQRMLWASTSTKNPAYSDTRYVEPLIGPHTINTMTDATIAAFMDHGRVTCCVEQGLADAHAVMEALEELGINMPFVTEQLLNEGIQKFIEPYNAMLDIIRSRSKRVLSASEAIPLQRMAQKLRRTIISMTTEAGSGHATSSLSSTDLVTALFFHEMRWDPSQPDARDVDTFVLSKGHAAPVLWAALYEAGAMTENPLTLRRVDSSLEGHPTPANPWVKVATGSLGQGLAAANGIAAANQMDGIEARVFCLLGDGECSEGSVWEAAQFASLNSLGRLVAIVDVNGLGQSGPTPYSHDTAVYARRFEAFGWKTLQIDGHDMPAILKALAQTHEGGPIAIIANTVKGKGVSFLEGRDDFHGKALDRGQMLQALTELRDASISLEVRPRHVPAQPPVEKELAGHLTPAYQTGEAVATRAAFGNALKKMGELNPAVVVLDGDVKNSTHTEAFAEAFPARFLESFIAEQNMVGTALGLAASGKVPYVATFACFLSRAYDFIRMAGHSRPRHMVFCGSHAGVSIGEDGPSQMGLEDIAMFRSVLGSTVLEPCDAVSAERLTEQAAGINGIVYLRTQRPKVPVIYPNDEHFPVGASKILRSSEADRFTLVAAGITVHEALAAHAMLQRDGIAVRVIDAYSIKPLDVSTLETAARETDALITVEDHWLEGGLGDAVAANVGRRVPLVRLAVHTEPHSGTPQELLGIQGISRQAIYEQVRLMTVQAEATHA